MTPTFWPQSDAPGDQHCAGAGIQGQVDPKNSGQAADTVEGDRRPVSQTHFSAFEEFLWKGADTATNNSNLENTFFWALSRLNNLQRLQIDLFTL